MSTRQLQRQPSQQDLLLSSTDVAVLDTEHLLGRGEKPFVTLTYTWLEPEQESQSKYEQTHEQEQEQEHLDNESNDKPQYDPSTGTRTGCIVATAIGMAAALTCLVYGSIILKNNPDTLSAEYPILRDHSYDDSYVNLDKIHRFQVERTNALIRTELGVLAVNVVLTLCIDGMMYVHAVSLRWALYDEGRLEYNTNIRLFTSSRRFRPNKWPVNIVALLSLVLTYAASSVMFIPQDGLLFNDYVVLIVNGTAVVAMGIGLAGQAVIALWTLLALRARPMILTWSSNPLNTTLAAVQHGRLSYEHGRCMLSVHQRHQWSNQEVYPVKRQSNMYQAQPVILFIIVILWVLAVLAITWPIIITLVLKGLYPNRFAFQLSWSVDIVQNLPITMYFSPAFNNAHNRTTFSYASESVLCVLFICLIQAGQAVALHCVELLVNLSRDESIWRNAYREGNKAAPGARLNMNPVLAAASSWEAVVLFFAKALLHWIIGQAMSPRIESYGNDMSRRRILLEMSYTRLFLYAALAVLLAVFGTFLACRRRRGYQPSAIGHLPTLANLVDDWRTDSKGRMWWGDKFPDARNESMSIRHAGTSPNKAFTGAIYGGLPYAGQDKGDAESSSQ